MVLAQNITGNKTIEAYIKEDKYEMELFSKYKQYYGYVFILEKKYSKNK
ncbi:MAG: hypothetical protein FWD47_11820 [Treponema sp.]|nr:hypothetical protein [Treponema sp.]